MKVGWIGLGVMGRAMAGHLLDAGHDLAVHTRTPATAADLLERGATWAETPAAVARDAQVVALMVGTPDDVRQVVLGRGSTPGSTPGSAADDGGALAAMAAGATLVDFTTSSPDLAAEIAARAASRAVHALDAPVSGGDVGARDATLSIMVGGTDEAFAAARPLLEVLGTTIVHQGPPGSGQHTKVVNQILVAGTMLGLSEALVYARTSGLDPSRVLDSVGGGAAASWALSHLAPRVLRGDVAPGFAIEHFVKDLGIALAEADRLGLDLPATALAHRLYDRLRDAGDGGLGTHALVLALGWPRT